MLQPATWLYGTLSLLAMVAALVGKKPSAPEAAAVLLGACLLSNLRFYLAPDLFGVRFYIALHFLETMAFWQLRRPGVGGWLYALAWTAALMLVIDLAAILVASQARSVRWLAAALRNGGFVVQLLIVGVGPYAGDLVRSLVRSDPGLPGAVQRGGAAHGVVEREASRRD